MEGSSAKLYSEVFFDQKTTDVFTFIVNYFETPLNSTIVQKVVFGLYIIKCIERKHVKKKIKAN